MVGGRPFWGFVLGAWAAATAPAQTCRFHFEGIRTYLLYDTGCSSVATADFDQDGLYDVAAHVGRVGSAFGVRTYEGKPGAWLEETATFAVSGSGWVVTGDFDGNSLADLAIFDVDAFTAVARIGVFLGDGSGGFLLRGWFPADGSNYAATVGSFGGGVTDDLAILDGARVHVRIGNGDGTFGPEIPTRLGMAATGSSAADFDGDGALDLAIAGGSEVDVLLGNGDGTFQPYVAYPLGGGALHVATGVLDRDGVVDIFAGYATLLGNGDGTFQPAVPQTTSAGVLADMDADGILDAVSTSSASGEAVCVAEGNGDRTFGTPTCWGLPAHASGVSVADIDGDGASDVLIFGGTEFVALARGHGDGTLAAPDRSAQPLYAADAELADLDLDGLLDLVGMANGAVWVARGKRDGKFESAWQIAATTNDADFTTADVDGDGYLDVASAWGPVFLGVGDGSLRVGRDLSLRGFDIVAADVDHDGRADLLAPTSGGLNVWLGRGWGTSGLPHLAVASSETGAYAYDGNSLRQLWGRFTPFPGGYGVNVASGLLGY